MRSALGERGEIIGKWTDWKPFPDPTKGDSSSRHLAKVAMDGIDRQRPRATQQQRIAVEDLKAAADHVRNR